MTSDSSTPDSTSPTMNSLRQCLSVLLGHLSHLCGRRDAAVWPFATSQTLVGLANVLRNYPIRSVPVRA